jgi:kynurenine formamidase
MVYYNGYRAQQDVKGPHEMAQGCCDGGHQSHADALGIENMAVHGMQGRGVLVDLARHFGRERKLIGYEELAAVMAQDGVTVERGDFLVLRTGFAELVTEMGGNPDPQVLHHTCPVLNGRDQQLLEWITDSGIAAICADNYAVEAYPAPDVAGRKSILPLHHHCLFKLGIPLGELWYLRDLAAWLQENGRNRFMLTAPPLRLPGAVGSPVTPVATV